MLRSSTADFFETLEEILNFEQDARNRMNTEESCFGDEGEFNPFAEPTEGLTVQQEAQAPIPEFSPEDLRIEQEDSLFAGELFPDIWDSVNLTEPTEDLTTQQATQAPIPEFSLEDLRKEPEDSLFAGELLSDSWYSVSAAESLTFLAELEELKALESRVDGDLRSEPEVHLDPVDLMPKQSAVMRQIPEVVPAELNKSRKRNACKQEDIVDAKTGELIDEAELYHKNKKAITYDAFLKRHYRFVETGVPLTRDQKREIHYVDGDFYFRGQKVVRARKEYNNVTSHSTYGRLFARSAQSNPEAKAKAKAERIIVRLKK